MTIRACFVILLLLSIVGQLNYCTGGPGPLRMSHCDSAPAAKRLKTTASEYFSIEVKGHGSKLLQNMNRARLEERLCDFKFQVGKQIIHAHKIVLAERCDYFRAMLSHPMKESNEGIVEMVDVDFECLEICIEYIYLRRITVMKDKLQSLLEVAHRLQLNVTEFCEEAAKNLEDNLSLDTFFNIKSVATALDLKKLGKNCDDFALKNLPGIVPQGDFVKIDLEYPKFLMNATGPSAMKCKAFLTWANYDPDNRGKEFEEFFLNLDMNQLPSSYLTFLEQNEALFFNSNKCLRKFMQSKLPFYAAKDFDLSGLQNDRVFTRFAVFDRISNAIQVYGPDQDAWTELHKLSPEISALNIFTAIAVGECIFVFASDQRNWMLRYSDKNSTWCALPNRSITTYVKVVEVDGLIYAFDETYKDGKSVEVYDGSAWSHVTDKPVAGCVTCILAAGDSIYCIGGLGVEPYSHCNKYGTSKKCWSSLPPMPEKKRSGSAAEVDRKIYVIGGMDQCARVLSTCLVFDIETEVWTKVASMSNPRLWFCALPVAGKIFSIGSEHYSNTVEEFNPSTGKWRTVTTLSGKDIFARASFAL